MSLSIAKSVNFGAIKGGLSTVGYTLKNSDGTIKLARVASGIVELVANKGIYGTNINFDMGFTGFLIWDSGDASPYYAIENFDSRVYAGIGGGVALHSSPKPKEITVWSLGDKKKILKNLQSILEAVESSTTKVDNLSEGINREINNIRHKDLKILLERRIEFPNIVEVMQDLLESIRQLENKEIDFSQVLVTLNKSIKLVESQNKFFEPIIEGIGTLIETEQAKIIQREQADEQTANVN